MEKNLKTNEKKASVEYITYKERKQLLSALHSRLFWVGQHIPDYVEFEGETYPLHNYVWELILKDELSQAENQGSINASKLSQQRKKRMKRNWKKGP